MQPWAILSLSFVPFSASKGAEERKREKRNDRFTLWTIGKRVLSKRYPLWDIRVIISVERRYVGSKILMAFLLTYFILFVINDNIIELERVRIIRLISFFFQVSFTYVNFSKYWNWHSMTAKKYIIKFIKLIVYYKKLI